MEKKYQKVTPGEICSEKLGLEQINNMKTDASVAVDEICDMFDRLIKNPYISKINYGALSIGIGYSSFVEAETIQSTTGCSNEEVDKDKVLDDTVGIVIGYPMILTGLEKTGTFNDWMPLDELEEIIPSEVDKEFDGKEFVVSNSDFINELVKRKVINEEERNEILSKYENLRKFPYDDSWYDIVKKHLNIPGYTTIEEQTNTYDESSSKRHR